MKKIKFKYSKIMVPKKPNIYKYLIDNGVDSNIADNAQEMHNMWAFDFELNIKNQFKEKIGDVFNSFINRAETILEDLTDNISNVQNQFDEDFWIIDDY